MADSSLVIGSIEKNKLEDVVVRLEEFKGHRYVDIRIFADFNDMGEKNPTKKGLALKLSCLSQLVETLQKAEAEAKRLGYL